MHYDSGNNSVEYDSGNNSVEYNFGSNSVQYDSGRNFTNECRAVVMKVMNLVFIKSVAFLDLLCEYQLFEVWPASLGLLIS